MHTDLEMVREFGCGRESKGIHRYMRVFHMYELM